MQFDFLPMATRNVLKIALWPAALLILLGLGGAAGPAHSQFSEGSGAAQATAVDPAILFSTYFGGGSSECLFNRCSIAVGADGAIYVAGTTTSTDFPLVKQYAACAGGGASSIFVTKFAANGASVLYSTCIGPGAAEALAIDSVGNAYVTGHTASSSFPTTENAVQPERAGGLDAVVFKLNANGNQLLYSTFLGGERDDHGLDIVVDSSSNIYVTGQTRSSDFPTANAFQPEKGDDVTTRTDAFVTKIAANGESFIFSTYLGGDHNDSGYAIALDSANHVYVGGVTYSGDFPTQNPIQTCRDGNATTFCADGFISKFTPDGGNLVYSSYVSSGTTILDEVHAIAVDGQGNAYLTGRGFLRAAIKINPAGSAFSYYTPISGLDQGTGLAVNEQGQLFLTGQYREGTTRDAQVAGLTSRGIVAVNERLGGSQDDVGMGIALGSGHNVYVVGRTASPDFPMLNPLQGELDGPTDLFVTQLVIEIEEYDLFLPLIVNP